MVITVAEVSALVSLAALGTAIYGIFERGNAAKRAERLRLTVIVENIARARGELTDLVSAGVTFGDKIEVINSRIELLAQQARSLLQKYHLEVTSTECREIAVALEECGLIDSADEVWLLARDKAQEEGNTQELYSGRGYAWFLFRNQRKGEARKVVREALSRLQAEKDSDRVIRAGTLRTWLIWEIDIDGPTSPIVAELSQQIDETINECVTVRGKQMASKWAYTVAAVEADNTERANPVSHPQQPPKAIRANKTQAKRPGQSK